MTPRLINRSSTLSPKKHNPATEEERELVQSITDSTWRMQRIVQLAFAIYANGSIELAEELANEIKDLEPAARAQLIQIETHLKYERSLRNLNTQEACLQRRLAEDKAELARVQNSKVKSPSSKSSPRALQRPKTKPPRPKMQKVR